MPLSGNLGPGIPGTPVQLNTENVEVEWTGLSWSKDGKWIAFNEEPIKDKHEQGIYVVSSKNISIVDNKIENIIDSDGIEIEAKHYVINMRIDELVDEYLPEAV